MYSNYPFEIASPSTTGFLRFGLCGYLPLVIHPGAIGYTFPGDLRRSGSAVVATADELPRPAHYGERAPDGGPPGRNLQRHRCGLRAAHVVRVR